MRALFLFLVLFLLVGCAGGTDTPKEDVEKEDPMDEEGTGIDDVFGEPAQEVDPPEIPI